MFPCSGREATGLRDWVIHSNVIGVAHGDSRCQTGEFQIGVSRSCFWRVGDAGLTPVFFDGCRGMCP